MDDFFRDPDTRVLSEAPARARIHPVFIRDSHRDVWAVELSVTSAELVIRFPFHPNSRSPFARENVFGLEASFHAASCIVAWVTVPPQYRRRKLALWMTHRVAQECSHMGMRWISGTIEPNEEALPFWTALNPVITKEGKPVRSGQAKNRRGIKFTLDTKLLAATPAPLALLTEKEFQSALQSGVSPVSLPPSPSSNTDPFWLPL